jgi:hypothetical protein
MKKVSVFGIVRRARGPLPFAIGLAVISTLLTLTSSVNAENSPHVTTMSVSVMPEYDQPAV